MLWQWFSGYRDAPEQIMMIHLISIVSKEALNNRPNTGPPFVTLQFYEQSGATHFRPEINNPTEAVR